MHAILKKAVELESAGSIDAVIDYVLYEINELLSEGWFSEIDRVLSEASERASLKIAVALLSATVKFKTRLRYYGQLFAAARDQALKEHDEATTKLLLGGLE